MPVDSKHPYYGTFSPQWKTCFDAYEGEIAIKACGQEYLPKLTAQTDPEYNAYLGRAMFAPFMMRTVQGLTGAAVYKDFKIDLPASIEHLSENASGTEMSLQAMIKQAITGLLVAGRIGLLVDRSSFLEAPPYLVYYTAQQIINWRADAAGKLSMVVLEEMSEVVSSTDAYAVELKTVWRVLRLIENVYTQEVYEKKADTQEFIRVESVVPARRGKPLDYIPFTIINVYGIGGAVEKPPLYDFASVNLSHFRNSADLEHGRHFCGLPILFLTGINSDNPIKVGSSTAMVVSDPAANGKYIEFTGNGLGSLEKALADKAALMAVLGARLLESQRPGVEAADTVRLRQMGDVFTLTALNMSLADGLAKALGFADQWQGGDGEIVVEPNKDFSNAAIDPAEMAALMSLWQSSAISLETLLFNLQRGEKLPPGTDIEDEISRIDLQRAKSGLPELTPEERSAMKSAKG